MLTTTHADDSSATLEISDTELKLLNRYPVKSLQRTNQKPETSLNSLKSARYLRANDNGGHESAKHVAAAASMVGGLQS